jgi:nucleotide-binding universal stress UspA family protein
MKKVLITLDYDPSPHKVAETGFSIAKTLGVGITLQHVETDELYFKLLDIVTVMGNYSQRNISNGIQKMGVELKDLSVQFLNATNINVGDANVHTLIKNGDSNESVLELAKEINADVIVIIMALHGRKWLKNRNVESTAENVSLNSSVPVLVIPIFRNLTTKHFKMNAIKQLGILMDHSTAHIIELSDNGVATKTIELSPAVPEQKEDLDESLMNNKEQNQLTDYFLNLSKVIKEYNEVLLFGPSSTKTELFDRLKEDSQFDKIQIDVLATDNMTDVEQEAYVRKFFAA